MCRHGRKVVNDLNLVLPPSFLHNAQATPCQPHKPWFHDQPLQPPSRLNLQLLIVNVDCCHLELLAGVKTEEREAILRLEDEVREGTDHLPRADGPASPLHQHPALLVTLLMGFQGCIGLTCLVTEAALEGPNSNGALLVPLVVGLQAALLRELVTTQLARVRLLTGVHHRVCRQVLHCLELLVTAITGQHLLIVINFDVVPQLVVGLRISGASTTLFTSLGYKRALMSGQVPFQTVQTPKLLINPSPLHIAVLTKYQLLRCLAVYKVNVFLQLRVVEESLSTDVTFEREIFGMLLRLVFLQLQFCLESFQAEIAIVWRRITVFLVVPSQELSVWKTLGAIHAVVCFLHVQQHVAFQVALLREFLSTLLTDDWVCVHFLMHHQNVPSEELFWAEGAMKISLPRLVHQHMTQQLYFSLKTLAAQVAQLSRDVWMSSDDVLRQPQLALDHLFAMFAGVFENLFRF